MTTHELFELLINKAKEVAPDKELDILHKAMLMECCENAIEASKKTELSTEALMITTLSALEVCRTVMKGMLKGLIPQAADTVTINYRGHTFIFNQDSPLLK